MSLDDYFNELFARNTLEQIADELSGPLERLLVSLLKPLDARFQQATEPSSKLQGWRRSHPATYWWWDRIPVRLGEDTSEELAALG
jgi:hypothetical protein